MNIKNTVGLLSAATVAAVVLTACASGLDSSESKDTTTTASASPSSAAPAGASSTAPSSDPSASADPSASTDPSATGKPSAGGLDGVQIVIQSSSEVSPGTLQYGSYSASGDIEWMGLKGRTAYDGEKCASVVTLIGPGGDVLFTDRQSSCSGSTSFSLSDSKNGTGEFTVDVSMAPWDDADNPVEASTTFTVIAKGA